MNHKFITHLSCGLAIVLVLCAGVFGQGTYRSLRIFVRNPYLFYPDTIQLRLGDTFPQFGIQAQRLDDTTLWEIVTPIWSHDSSLHLGTVPITGSGWIYARYNDAGTVLSDSVWVIILEAYRLWIEADNTPNPHIPNPVPMLVFGPITRDTVWAVLRDQLGNFVGFSITTKWVSTDTNVAKVTNGNSAMGEGIVIPGSGGAGHDSTWIIARNGIDITLQDSFIVIRSNVTYDQIGIMQRNPASGQLEQIYQLYDTIPRDTTLYVQAHRTDGLGGTGGWVSVSGNWSLSSSLLGKTSPTLPPTNFNCWTFAPIDTGTGTITVSIAGGPSATLNPVVFPAGLPNLIAIYPQAGIPEASNNPWPADPAVADTAVVDSPYNLLYAKLFYMTPTGKVIWLRQYEDSVQLAQQFSWTISSYPSDTISAIIPNHITLKSSSGNRLIRVTANWNALAYSILVLMIPNQPNSIMENRDLNLRRNNWSVSSVYGRIFVHFPDNAAYDIRVFSLAGYCIVSRLASDCDVSFRLPNGVYIVAVKSAVSPHETRKKVVVIGR